MEYGTILIDNLDYDYDGNRLINVTDKTNHSLGFNDGNKHVESNENDFEYDDYGNMVIDRNKEITNITYNHLNLPKKITFENNRSIEYIYDASGGKLKKTVTDGSTTKTVDYLNGYQYENNQLSFFPTAEGYIKAVATGIGGGGGTIYSFHYIYNYTDHLGNIRVRYTKDPQTGTIKPLEENHYYPFACPVRSFRGLKHQGYNHTHQVLEFDPIEGNVALIDIPQNATDGYKYKYNGKEYQDELGLDWYDFGARNYDAAIGRWMNVDPLADETLQAYSAFNNNPLYYNDPTGMIGESVGVKDLGEGKYEVVSGNVDDGDKGVYIVDSNGSYDINSSEKIGNTITTHSFFDDNENVVEGAVIDMNSNEGQEFLDQLMEDNPSRLGYMWNARNGKKYDFKEKGIKERGSLTRNQHRNRGSVNSNGEIGSARDYGNIGAGMVAARKGLSWGAARSGFDLYQGYKSNGVTLLSTPGAIRGTRSISVPTILPEREATTSVKAQMTGFLMGLQKFR